MYKLAAVCLDHVNAREGITLLGGGRGGGGKFQWFQVTGYAQNSNIVYFSQWLRVREIRCPRMESLFGECWMRERLVYLELDF